MTNTEYMIRQQSIDEKIRELDTACWILKKIRSDYKSSLESLTMHYVIGQHENKMEKYNV